MAAQQEGQQEAEVPTPTEGVLGGFFRRVLGGRGETQAIQVESTSSEEEDAEEDEGTIHMAQPVGVNTPRSPYPHLCRVCQVGFEERRRVRCDGCTRRVH